MYNKSKEILLYKDHFEELSERSDEVDIKTQMKEIREIISAIKHTMEKNDLKILSAPYIGFKKRIFCIAFQEEIKTFINPIIAHAEDIQLSRETDCTLPGKSYIRPRNSKIDIIYQRPTGQTEQKQLLGAAAVLFQQGMDAIDGISLDDIGLEIDSDFDNASDEERIEIINMYLDSLDLRNKQAQEEIENNPELNQYQKGIDFLASVKTGKTKISYEY